MYSESPGRGAHREVALPGAQPAPGHAERRGGRGGEPAPGWVDVHGRRRPRRGASRSAPCPVPSAARPRRGPTRLLADGCFPVCAVADILTALALRGVVLPGAAAGAPGRGPGLARRRTPRARWRRRPRRTDRALFEALSSDPASLDHLARLTGMELPALCGGLERLARDGRGPGRRGVVGEDVVCDAVEGLFLDEPDLGALAGRGRAGRPATGSTPSSCRRAAGRRHRAGRRRGSWATRHPARGADRPGDAAPPAPDRVGPRDDDVGPGLRRPGRAGLHRPVHRGRRSRRSPCAGRCGRKGVAVGEGPHYPVAGAINRPLPQRAGGPPIALDLTDGRPARGERSDRRVRPRARSRRPSAPRRSCCRPAWTSAGCRTI